MDKFIYAVLDPYSECPTFYVHVGNYMQDTIIVTLEKGEIPSDVDMDIKRLIKEELYLIKTHYFNRYRYIQKDQEIHKGLYHIVRYPNMRVYSTELKDILTDAWLNARLIRRLESEEEERA